jgi:hypothetical protein
MTFHIDDISQKSKREILEVWDEAVKHMGLQDKRIAELEQVMFDLLSLRSFRISFLFEADKIKQLMEHKDDE